MADYRFSAKVIKRSDGRSAVAASAYRSAERLIDMRTGESHDYTRKSGVVHTEILTPENCPEALKTRADLWNAVEKIERRKDAQLAREIQLSLPHELTHQQRVDLAREFVREQFTSHGMIADLAIHKPDRNSDQRNHHAHIMLTMRKLTREGLGQKNRIWNTREMIGHWREQWARHQNRTLERHDHKQRGDHRSYEARGINQEPTHHLGQTAHSMETKNKPSRIGKQNRVIEHRNASRANIMAREALLTARISAITAKENKQIREYEHLRETACHQLARVNDRLNHAKGFKKVIRHLTGKTRHDRRLKYRLERAVATLDRAETLRREQIKLVYQRQKKETNWKDWIPATERTIDIPKAWQGAVSQSNDNDPWRSETQKHAKEEGRERKPPYMNLKPRGSPGLG